MIDEARLRIKAKSDEEPDRQKAKDLIEQLSEVVNLTLYDGFPAHLHLTVAAGGTNWRYREIYQRNAEVALYAAVHAWAEVGYPRDLMGKNECQGGWTFGPVKIAWPEPATSPASAMLNRLRAQWTLETVLRSLFARWDFGKEQDFGVIDLMDFDLFGVNLGGANLSCANLVGANLIGADLGGANLGGANLSRIDLGAVVLVLDNQRETTIRVNLSGADCSRLQIDSARLHHADLSDVVNLTQEQVDKAHGNSSTKLPDDLHRPGHWSDDD